MRPLPLLSALLLIAAPMLAACEGGDPVEQALKETAAKNHADATRTTAEVEDAHAAHAPAAGPTQADRAFAASETEMHRLMAEASGETIDEAYIAKMIAHHQGAVAMAEVAMRDSRDPEVRRMAQAVIDAQTREIAEMRAWKPASR